EDDLHFTGVNIILDYLRERRGLELLAVRALEVAPEGDSNRSVRLAEEGFAVGFNILDVYRDRLAGTGIGARACRMRTVPDDCPADKESCEHDCCRNQEFIIGIHMRRMIPQPLACKPPSRAPSFLPF